MVSENITLMDSEELQELNAIAKANMLGAKAMTLFKSHPKLIDVQGWHSSLPLSAFVLLSGSSPLGHDLWWW